LLVPGSCYNNSCMVDPEERRIREDVENLINSDRLVNFSDSVFAFAATLLVLKIDLPEIPRDVVAANFYSELFALWPAYVANLISFLIIAYYWRQHHALFILIKKYNSTIVWLNVVLLISVAFLPFPVDLFGDYSDIPAVTVFYSLSVSLVGVLMLLIWIYASKNNLLRVHLGKKDLQYHTWTFIAAPLIFLTSIPIILIDHITAKVSWLSLILVLVILNKVFKRHRFKNSETGPV
jgi:uncharacterized membrane protein